MKIVKQVMNTVVLVSDGNQQIFVSLPKWINHAHFMAGHKKNAALDFVFLSNVPVEIE